MPKQPASKKPRSEKVANRAEKKMTKAKVSWTKAEQARQDSQNTGKTKSPLHSSVSTMDSYANKQYDKAAAQERKAKELKAKSARLKEVESVKSSKKK